MKKINMKKITVGLSIFPGSLLALSLISYIICAIAESDLPSGGVNIGLCLILLAALINIPTILAWCTLFFKKRKENNEFLNKTQIQKNEI